MKLVISASIGQLGNCLYRLANVLAISRENGWEVYDLAFANGKYSSFFKRMANKPLVRYPEIANMPFSCAGIQKFTYKTVRHLLKYNLIHPIEITDEQGAPGKTYDLTRLKEFNSNQTIFLRGVNFTADECVRKHQDFLREYFEPSIEVVKKTHDVHARFSRGFDMIVGVHVRQGDFKQWLEGSFYFSTKDYAEYMHYIQSQSTGGNIRFLIFGNLDKEFDSRDYGDLNVERVCGTSEEDLYHLSLCNLIVSPLYSTFSGWAAFYGKVPLLRISEKFSEFDLHSLSHPEVLNNSFKSDHLCLLA
jgi:hypothetical protein|tara:strand:+ start:2194 stop:3105 length:912 start_codon:yes stop_codon:yes gene_type:complete